MKNINMEQVRELAGVRGVCLSLYMKTHRMHPDNQQDPIRFKNLVKELEASLLQQYERTQVQAWLQPFDDLSSRRNFWNHTLEGLAVLSSEGQFHTFTLPVDMPELVIVASSFHTKPLRRYLQSADRFQVVAVGLQDFRVYEGNRHSLSELELPADVPKTLRKALSEQVAESQPAASAVPGAHSSIRLEAINRRMSWKPTYIAISETCR